MESLLEVGSGGPFSPSVWPHNPATRFRPPSATVVSAEPFSYGTGTLRCLQNETATYRHWFVSLWRDPDDVPHCRILSPDKNEWRLISTTLCGWGRCFVADQLWFMTRIREEEEDYSIVGFNVPLDTFEITSWNFYGSKIWSLVKSSSESEDGCIPMHWNTRLMTRRLWRFS